MSALQFAEVIDVRGIKVRAKVYSKKNTTMLFHFGEIIKNVSVGSYVKIVKGFTEIIGVVEGEFVTEKSIQPQKFISNEESFERIIEIKILGTLEPKKFKRGISDMPLLYNPVMILDPDEYKLIFNQYTETYRPIGQVKIGTLINDNNIDVNINLSDLINGHVGIFGNTGSGKSNTLAKLYKEVFDIGQKSELFKENSKFLFIDFNGEYERETLSNEKCIKYINTRKSQGENKVDIEKEELFNSEILSIILEATEKTQAPFIERCLKFTDRYFAENFESTEVILDNITTLLHDNRYNIRDLQKYFNDLYQLIIPNNGYDYFSKFRYVTNPNIDSLMTGERTFINTKEELREIISRDLSGLIVVDYLHLSYEKKLEISFSYKFLEELGKSYINREHIAPLLKRLPRLFNLVSKVFNVGGYSSEINPITVINLKKADLHTKKVVPLIICKSEYDRHIRKNNGAQDKILNIIIDEAHNILSAQSDRELQEWKDYRLEVFEEIIKEGRKFGAFLTIASQRPSDISATVISQLNHYFIHRLMNQEDLNRIQSTVTFLDKNSFDMISSLPPGGCILTGSSINFPILVQIDKLDEKNRPTSENYDIIKMWFPGK